MIVLVAWLLFCAAWFRLGIPMGPVYPASLQRSGRPVGLGGEQVQAEVLG